MTLSWLVREQVGAERGKLTLLGRLRGVILMILEAPARISEALGALLEPLGRVLGDSWEALGGVWELFGRYVGAWRVHLKRIIEILKNH